MNFLFRIILNSVIFTTTMSIESRLQALESDKVDSKSPEQLPIKNIPETSDFYLIHNIYTGNVERSPFLTNQAKSLKNIYELRELSLVVTEINVLGYYTVNDGGGGRFYWDANSTETDNGGTIIKLDNINVGRYKRVIDKNYVKVAWFGAIPDGVTDNTTALKAVYKFVQDKRSSPFQFDGWGHTTIVWDKGEYVVTNTLTNKLASFLGCRNIGVGEYGTQITYNSDSGVLFDFGAHISNTFEHMSIVHKPVNADNSTWTCSAFKFIGNGGGRRFTLNNVAVRNFNIHIEHDTSFNANNDTNFFEGCTFQDFNHFVYSQNTQAVVNEFNQCTWTGDGHIFTIAGFQHLNINGGNIVTSGRWFNFLDIAGKYGGSSIYNLNNVKGEYSQDANGDYTTSLIHADGINIQASITMNNCGISNASIVPHVDSRQFLLGATGLKININGGAFTNARIETISRTTNLIGKASHMTFNDCRSVPNPVNITRLAGGFQGRGNISITYLNCAEYPNITFTDATSFVKDAEHSNVITRNNVADSRLTNGTAFTGDTELLFYGQKTIIKEMGVYIENNGTTTAQVYSDEAKTVLEEEISFPSSTSGTYFPFSTIIGDVFTDGLYFSVKNTVGTSKGKVIIKTINV